MARTLSAILLGIAVAALANAQQGDDGGCVYDRRVHPPGSERCQDGTRVRCADGAWEDVGFCEAEPEPPPRDSGGDVDEAGS